MNLSITIHIIILLFSALYSTPETEKIQYNTFKLGNEVLLSSELSKIQNQSVALITNSSGILSDGRLFLDVLIEKQVPVKKIFSPEHGFRVDDNEKTHTDPVTGLPVISLHGSKKQPSADDLKDIDILIYDIQDVTSRFYTYINTMYLCMKSAKNSGKKFIVCDRPIIGNPDYVDGFLLRKEAESFVGMLDIPIYYGMTCGELAIFLNAEYFNNSLDLEIIKMHSYSRTTDYNKLNLAWVKPSPNMFFPSTAVVYPGTCLLEGTNFSEGRGTEKPFEYVGAPWCQSRQLIEELNKYNFKGVEFEEIEFTPGKITGSFIPKFTDQKCQGIYIKVTDKFLFEPVKVGIAILISLKKLFPEFEWRKDNFVDKLAGTSELRKMINKGKSLEEIISAYTHALENFNLKRQNYLLYN